MKLNKRPWRRVARLALSSLRAFVRVSHTRPGSDSSSKPSPQQSSTGRLQRPLCGDGARLGRLFRPGLGEARRGCLLHPHCPVGGGGSSRASPRRQPMASLPVALSLAWTAVSAHVRSAPACCSKQSAVRPGFWERGLRASGVLRLEPGSLCHGICTIRTAFLLVTSLSPSSRKWPSPVSPYRDTIWASAWSGVSPTVTLTDLRSSLLPVTLEGLSLLVTPGKGGP